MPGDCVGWYCLCCQQLNLAILLPTFSVFKINQFIHNISTCVSYVTSEHFLSAYKYSRQDPNKHRKILIDATYMIFRRRFDLVMSAYILFTYGGPGESNPQPWRCKHHALPTEPYSTNLGNTSSSVTTIAMIDLHEV